MLNHRFDNVRIREEEFSFFQIFFGDHRSVFFARRNGEIHHRLRFESVRSHFFQFGKRKSNGGNGGPFKRARADLFQFAGGKIRHFQSRAVVERLFADFFHRGGKQYVAEIRPIRKRVRGDFRGFKALSVYGYVFGNHHYFQSVARHISGFRVVARDRSRAVAVIRCDVSAVYGIIEGYVEIYVCFEGSRKIVILPEVFHGNKRKFLFRISVFQRGAVFFVDRGKKFFRREILSFCFTDRRLIGFARKRIFVIHGDDGRRAIPGIHHFVFNAGRIAEFVHRFGKDSPTRRISDERGSGKRFGIFRLSEIEKRDAFHTAENRIARRRDIIL